MYMCVRVCSMYRVRKEKKKGKTEIEMIRFFECSSEGGIRFSDSEPARYFI